MSLGLCSIGRVCARATREGDRAGTGSPRGWKRGSKDWSSAEGYLRLDGGQRSDSWWEDDEMMKKLKSRTTLGAFGGSQCRIGPGIFLTVF